MPKQELITGIETFVLAVNGVSIKVARSCDPKAQCRRKRKLHVLQNNPAGPQPHL